MKCQFLKGRREAWQWIDVLLSFQAVTIILLVIYIINKGRKVIDNIVESRNSNFNQMLVTDSENNNHSNYAAPCATEMPHIAILADL